jgi:hypothetical protein
MVEQRKGTLTFRIFTNTASVSSATLDPNLPNNSVTAISKLGEIVTLETQ